MKDRIRTLLRDRSVLLAVAGLGLLALFVLAAGLNGMDLKPAERFVGPEQQQNPYDLWNRISNTSLAEKILLLAGLVMLFAILLVLLPPESRKKVLLAVLRYSILVAIVLYVLDRSQPMEILPDLTGDAQDVPGRTTEQIGTLVEFQEPPMPPWFIYVTSLVVVALVIGGGWWLWRRWSRPRAYPPLREYAVIAREALDGLSAGRDWRDTIVKCYIRMSEVVRDERGMDRSLAMTASEFSVQLVRAGLPAEPVRRLTRLFEQVRYGEQTATPEQVNEAVDCLTAIARACGAEAI